MRELLDEQLATRTTFQLGGPARSLIEVTTEVEVADAVHSCREDDDPFIVLAGGSNVLVADSGLDSTVLQPALRGVRREERTDGVALFAGAGEPWDELVAMAADEGLSGVECLAGIPGWVGATPIQNVGAYGQEVGTTIESVRVLDIVNDRVAQLSAAQCGFRYRQSIFKGKQRGRYLILGVTFLLRRSPGLRPQHREVQQLLGSADRSAEPRHIRQAVLEIRRRKSMIVDAADPESHSAGSFFTNPILDQRAFDRLVGRARATGILRPGESVPCYPVGQAAWKIPAAWLIEQAGFHKGYGSEAVGLSRKHTLSIVHRGGGSAHDVLSLALEVMDTVYQRFAVKLRAEPTLLGFAQEARRLGGATDCAADPSGGMP